MVTKAGLGSSPIERQAIEAHLARLKLEIDPRTRELKSAGEVEGGMDAIQRAAGPSGELSLHGLASLQRHRAPGELISDRIARMRGRDDASVAAASLKGAQAALHAASLGLVALTKDTDDGRTFEPLARVARRITHAADSVKQALSTSSLSYATDEQLGQLRSNWGAFMETVASHLRSVRQLSSSLDSKLSVALDLWQNSRGLAKMGFGRYANTLIERKNELERAWSAIAWLTDNLKLYEVRPGTREEVWAADRGTTDERLIGLAQLGIGLAPEHPEKARYASEIYDLISRFSYRYTADDPREQRLVLSNAVRSAHFTLQRIFDTERYVKPQDRRASLIAHTRDSLEYTVRYDRSGSMLDTNRLTFQILAKRAEITGETKLAERMNAMSDVIWGSERSLRTNLVSGLTARATEIFSASIQEWDSPGHVQRSAAAQKIRELLSENVGYDGYNRDLRESTLDAALLGAIAFIKLDDPYRAQDYYAEYAKFASEPTPTFVSAGRALLGKIADQLETSYNSDSTEVRARKSDGVHYSVLEKKDGTRALRMSVKIETEGDRVRFVEIPGRPEMPKHLMQHLTFRVTTDGWKSFEDAGHPAWSTYAGEGGTWLTFEQPIKSTGDVEGAFYYRLMKDQDFAKDELAWIHHHGGNFRGYQLE